MEVSSETSDNKEGKILSSTKRDPAFEAKDTPIGKIQQVLSCTGLVSPNGDTNPYLFIIIYAIYMENWNSCSLLSITVDK